MINIDKKHFSNTEIAEVHRTLSNNIILVVADISGMLVDDIINKKIAVSKSLPINIDATDTKGCNFLDQRQIWWSNFQIIFWLSGTIQLVLFFLFK